MRVTAAPQIWLRGIMNGKNNASTIYHNICPHVTITTLAVELSANGERAHVKKYLNR
jgi:hypothetical protein